MMEGPKDIIVVEESSGTRDDEQFGMEITNNTMLQSGRETMKLLMTLMVAGMMIREG